MGYGVVTSPATVVFCASAAAAERTAAIHRGIVAISRIMACAPAPAGLFYL